VTNEPLFDETHRVSRELALRRRLAVDVALDREQGIHPLDGLDGDRRLVDPRQIEELAPRMRPARPLDNRSRLARGLIELIEPRIGIRLHEAGIIRQEAVENHGPGDKGRYCFSPPAVGVACREIFRP
jgi:hypothetical protein